MKSKKNNEKISKHTEYVEGITLIALVVTIVVLLILAGVTITLIFGENSIFDIAKEAAEKTNDAIEDEKTAVEGLDTYVKDKAGSTGGSEEPDTPTPEEPSLKPSNNEENIEEVTFSTAYGKIDVIWLEGTSNTPIAAPNSPANYLNGMTPVKWNGTTEGTTTVSDTSWYSYNEATGTTDSKTSYWANAKTSNGSYFVWIPRYAYRITYYDKDPNTDSTAAITGYYDGYGMWRASDGAIKCKLETDNNGKTLVETIANYNDKSYIVHPAFTTNLDMGGWSTNLPGFWFAKFEMSGSSASTLASAPGVASYTNETIGTFYTVARSATYGMTGTKDTVDNNMSFMYSHMAKNSEWGAVAYLTHSKYGRNGYEIGMNKNSSYYTGGASGATAYTGTSNQLQSTTGNPYGVYDMRGGSYEYTASWDTLAADSNNYISQYGSSFASKNGNSTKYATAYKNGTTTYYGSPNVYNVCKTGDGIREVYVSGNIGWHSDYSNFACSTHPFFKRGGYYGNNEANTGVFASNSNIGYAISDSGFRGVLCP